jgi:lipid-binding SYLF domain-containing protein
MFAGLSLEGAVIQPDESANKDYWKSALTGDQILTRPAVDARVGVLIAELEKLLSQAK